MPHDPVRLGDTREWLVLASEDLRAADIDRDASPPLLRDAMFHCQQAVEKALKAFLTWHDQPFRKTHDIGEMGSLCAAIDPTLELLLRQAAPITEFAWAFRYPGHRQLPMREEVEATVALAHEIYHAILARLPGGARP